MNLPAPSLAQLAAAPSATAVNTAEPMRVLIVTFEFLPFSGGIAVYSDAIARGLANLDCDVRVLAPRYPGSDTVDERGRLHTVRMKVGHGTAEWRRFVPGVAYLDRQLRTFKPDVVLLTSDLAHGIGALACARRGIPFVTVVHGSEIAKHFPPKTLKQYVQSWWLRSSYRKAHAVFCVSQFVKTLMVAAGFDDAKLHVVRNGVDDGLVTASPSPERVDQLRRRHGLEGKRVILTLARLVSRKGQGDMIVAMPGIRERHPTACYLVAGTGPDAPGLRSLATELGVEEAVVFAGEIPGDEKIHYLDLCDVYALPSRGDPQRVEGLGIGLLEAAARGKPLIGGRHGGVREIIADGVNGYLVEPANPAELAERASRLLDDAVLARAMGEAARQTVVREFLTTRMARESKRLLEAVRVRGTKAST